MRFVSPPAPTNMTLFSAIPRHSNKSPGRTKQRLNYFGSLNIKVPCQHTTGVQQNLGPGRLRSTSSSCIRIPFVFVSIHDFREDDDEVCVQKGLVLDCSRIEELERSCARVSLRSCVHACACLRVYRRFSIPNTAKFSKFYGPC